MPRCDSRPQNALPVADVNPAVELDAHLLEVRDLLEAELLVQRDAGVVGERNPAKRGMDAACLERRDQFLVEPRADSPAPLVRSDVHRHFG
jgi:hypothetical protein